MGSLTLTWLFSGWLSVTPFGWLDSPGITERDRLAFAGGPLARRMCAIRRSRDRRMSLHG
jgi:hypothetical protein